MKLLKTIALLGVLACLVAGGWLYYAPVFIPDEVTEALDRPEKVALYSLEPEARVKKTETNFHDIKVLGKVKLDGDNARTVINAFQKAIIHGSPAVSGFRPSHGMQIISDDHIFDFLICYPCEEIDVYEDDKLISTYKAAGSPAVLDAMLERVHIPLAKGTDIETSPESRE